MGVRYDPGLGGALAVTSFSDSFVRANGTYLGTSWATLACSLGTDSDTNLDACINNGAGGATFGAGGGSNFNGCKSLMFPIAGVDYNAILVKSANAGSGLFSQMKLTGSIAGVDCSVGPAVLISLDTHSCYWLNLPSNVGFTQLIRGIGATQTLLSTPVFNYAVNDVVRIEAIVQSAQTVVKVYQNGTLVLTFNDNTGGRLTSGTFGIAFDGAFTGQQSFQNYSGGTL